MNPQQRFKLRLALLVNVIAPYRVATYSRLAEYFDLFILHGHMESNRAWEGIRVPGATTHQVWGWQFKVPENRSGKLFEQRFLHVCPGYFSELIRIRPQAIVTVELGLRTTLALIYGALFGIPVWVWWGGTLHTEANLGWRRVVRRLASILVRHWISYGETSTEYLASIGVDRDRILQIQNCVNEEWFSTPISPVFDLQPKPVVLHVGRMVQLKGISELLHAAARLQQDGETFSLALVGDGPDRRELEMLAISLGLRSVHFIPPQSAERMPAVYRSADVLVFPTMKDVWGLVANEAVLSRLPVLCSKYAGCAQELFSRECIFDPCEREDFVSALQKAIRGQIPRASTGVLKGSAEVADAIAREIGAVCRGNIGLDDCVRKVSQ